MTASFITPEQYVLFRACFHGLLLLQARGVVLFCYDITQEIQLIASSLYRCFVFGLLGHLAMAVVGEPSRTQR